MVAAKANGSSYTAQFWCAKPFGLKHKKIKVKRIGILDLSLRRIILPSARETNVVIRKAKLAHRVLTVARKDTSLIIALSRRKYFLT